MTKHNITLADGTEVEAEDVPMDRDLLGPALVLPESERKKHEPTPEEEQVDSQRAEELYKELEAIEEEDGQVKTH
jgi:hypothetical protein